jgi:excisionase family DNA binding protein
MSDEWLTLAQAAAYLKVSKPTLYRFCGVGCLPFYKLAGTGQRRFKRSDLDALLTPGQPDRAPPIGDECEELVGEIRRVNAG